MGEVVNKFEESGSKLVPIDQGRDRIRGSDSYLELERDGNNLEAIFKQMVQ